MHVIPTLRQMRQNNCYGLKDSHVYRVRVCLKNKGWSGEEKGKGKEVRKKNRKD